MAISRQTNFLGQMRVDVPHLKALESAVANDFDLLAGKMLSGKLPLIIKGFTVGTSTTIGTAVENLQLNVAGSLLMHYNASEAGTIFGIADTATAQTLNALNANVVGSFTAGVTNYVGLDLFRAADTATSDLVQFYDANTEQEVPQTVPLARTLQYKIIISTQNFTVSSNILPIAKVVTSASNLVVSITDARKLMFRLGSGGDNPSATGVYSWGTRLENPITFTGGGDSFTAEDKSIISLKGWMDMMMTTLWEARGGQTWYAPANRDNVKLTNGQPVLATGDNFFFPLRTIAAAGATRTGGNLVTVTSAAHEFVNGQVVDIGTPVVDPDFAAGTKTITVTGVNTFTYAEIGANVSNAQSLIISSLMWDGLTLSFENSTANNNVIVASAATGVAIPDGGCLYVDLIRESASTVNAVVAPLLSLGYSVIPGRRIIIAWRVGDYMYIKDRPFEVGRFLNPVATNLALGIVQLNQVAGVPAAPRVVSIMANGRIEVVASGGNAIAATFTGNGTGAGVSGNSGTGPGGDFNTNGAVALRGRGAGGGGVGIEGHGAPIGIGNGIGVRGYGGFDSGVGVYGEGLADIGGDFIGPGDGSGIGGVRGTGTSGAMGGAFYGNAAAVGVYAQGGASGIGVSGLGGGSAAGILGTGGSDGTGVRGVGGSTGGLGGAFTGTGGFGGVTGAGQGAGIGGVFTGGSTGAGATGQGGAGAATTGLAGTGGGAGSGLYGQGGNNQGIGVVGLGDQGGYGGYFTGGNAGDGVLANAGVAGGTGVRGNTTTGVGVHGVAAGAGVGVRGSSVGATGVEGSTTAGFGLRAIATTGTGTFSSSSSSYGGIFSGSTANPPPASAFRIVPQVAEPSTGAVGDLYVTLAGLLKICTVAGTPGTWVSVGAQ